MTVKKLLEDMDSREISEWMAYDITCNPKWQEKYESEKALEISKAMTQEQKVAAFKKLFKGK